jgi:hypothetical protein
MVIIVVSIFSMNLEEIYTLSYREETLNQSWSELLKYIEENEYTNKVVEYGEIISAKKELLSVYGNSNFIHHILAEDLAKFLSSLSVLREDILISTNDTKNILIIFPYIVQDLNEIFIKGYMEEDYFKSLYRLQGLEEKIQVPNFEAFLNNLVNEVIKNPVYLDQEMKNFVKKFIPKNILVKINDIISDNKIYLSENNFVSAYTLLNFLNNNHVINSENLTTLKKLESYFSLKSELTDMNNKVYFLEKAEMETFVQEIYQVGEKLAQMTLENDLLKNLYLSSIKTMNNKIYTIDENIISDVDLNKLIGKFDEDIENELIKLSSKLEIMDSTTIIENTIETNESTEIITTNKNNDEMKKEENYTLYIYIGIVLATVLFVFLIFEVSPSIKKVEFLCKIGLGKYALRISEKLVMKEPNNYKNYMAMAKAFEAIGEYNSSIVCYKKAMKLKEKGEIK